MVRPSEMSEILRQVGWTEGFNIPALNDENRILESQVAAMMREKASLMSSLAELDDLLGSLKSHSVELKNESIQNEAMLVTQQKRLDSEEALIKVLQGEQSRLKNAAALDRQQRKEVEERCKKIEQQLAENVPVRDLQVEKEHWQRQEMLASLTTNTLAQFYKEDESKLKELELQRLRLQEQVMTAFKQMHEANGNVVALEQQLDFCANQYKAALSEKAELSERWKTTAVSVRARDESCLSLKKEVSELTLLLNSKNEQMREARELEESEQRRGVEVEAHTRLLEHDLSRLREILKEHKGACSSVAEEVSSLQCHLAGCGSDLSEQMKMAQELSRQIREQEEHRDGLKEGCMQRKARLANLGDLTGDSEKRNQKLEAMVQEKARVVAGSKERLARLENEILKSKQEAGNVKLDIDNVLMAVNAEQLALKQSVLQKNALDKFLSGHRDMLLNADLEIHRTQLRLQKITNDKILDLENAARLASKEVILKEALDEKQATLAKLERELKNSQASERQLDVTLAAMQTQLSSLQEAERAYWSEVEGGEGKLLKNKAEVDKEQVKLSLLSAKVSKRNDDLAAIKAEVLSLKNTALQADRVEKLQSAEMASEVAALTAQVTAAQNEVTELKMAINRRKLRLQQLQGVVDMTLKSMEGSSAEELDSIQCITKQQIRVAQEKGELVQKGNQLDLHIRTAEQEIQAMEHTLALVKSANDRYRSSLALPGAQNTDSTDLDLQEKIEAEEKLHQELRAEFKKKKAEEAAILEKCQSMRDELAETDEKYQELINQSAERKHEVAELERDMADQEVKLRRAISQAKRLRRELRAGNPGPTFEERDLEVKEIRRVTSTALKQLWELGPDAQPLVKQYLQEKGLPCDQHTLHQSKVQPVKSPSLMSVQL